MKWNWWAAWLPVLLALVVGMTDVWQTSGAVHLTIRLRGSDGTAVAGETVILERLPEADPILPPCTTDAQGVCTWSVGRGLYQVLFSRPLDDISALAVAEGGLRGLGLTVGEEDIVYHFTFHNDGRVYFDAAPAAAVPWPIIPAGEALHGGIAPMPALPVIDNEPLEATPTSSQPTSAPDTAVRPASGNSWRLILFIGGGLVIGGGLHLWSRKRSKPDDKSARLNDEETKNA